MAAAEERAVSDGRAGDLHSSHSGGAPGAVAVVLFGTNALQLE